RNADEAQRLARGEDITVVREEGEEAAEAAVAAAEAFFEPEGVEARRAREAAEGTPPADAEAEKKKRPYVEAVRGACGQRVAISRRLPRRRGRGDMFRDCRFSQATRASRRRVLRTSPSWRYSSKASTFCRGGAATAACGGPVSAAPPGAAA